MKIIRIILLLLIGKLGYSQNLRLIAPVIQDTCGTTVDIPVKVNNFKKIVAMQGTVGWDATTCTYNSISSYGSGTIGLSSSNFGYSFTSSGKLVFSWSDATLNGKTLTDSTILFTIRLNVTGGNSTLSNIKFYNSPTPIEFIDSSLNTLTVDTVSGRVNIFCATCGISALSAGSQGNCNVSNNKYSQQIIVTYSNPPSSGTLVVNNQNFSITSSPQTVTLTNLNSDGIGVTATAYFSNDTACKKTVSNLFTAPQACRVVTLFTIPFTDTCFTTTDIDCRVKGFNNLISAQGSVSWDTSRLSFIGVTGFGSATLGLNSGNFGTSQTANGKLAFSWNDATLAGKTLADSTVFFTIRLLVKSGTGNTNINFGNSPTTLEFVDTSYSTVPVSALGGSVNVYCSNNCSISGISVGSQGSCNPLTNKYSQTLTITYSNPPGAGYLVVNGQNFAITSSPQTITLTNLLSNGASVNANASFSVNTSCAYNLNNAFTAPATCRKVRLYAPTFTDTCFTIADIPVKANLFHKIISMQGSVLWDTSLATYNSISSYGAAPLGLGASNFGIAHTNNGKLTFSWNDASLAGLTLADSSILFTLRLNLRTGSFARIRFLSSPTSIEFVDTSYTSLPVDTTSGIVNIYCANNCSITNISAGTSGTCNANTNLYSQPITVTYSNAPGAGNLIVNNQSFAVTGSPQTVTLTNLISSGTLQNVTAYFSFMPSCTYTANNLYTAPSPCKYVTLFAPTVTDTCLTTVDLPINVKGFKKIVSKQGTIIWDTSKVQYQSVVSYNSTLGMGASNIGTSFTAGGKLTFSWNDATLAGITLADSTTIFTLRFYIKGSFGATLLRFSNSPTAIEFVDSSLTTQFYDTLSGTINIYCSTCSVTSQPGNQNVCVGSGAAFSVSINNPAGATYQWMKNGSNISGATSSTYAISSTVASDAGNYSVFIGGSCGSLTSNTATLVVNPTPVITNQPSNITLCAGASATFTVTATGATSYQWRKGTSNISGANSASYTISSTSVSDAGTYDVLVTNSCGTTTSNGAVLTVNTSPTISSHPSNLTLCAGASATFSVTASGATSYQWRKNTNNITGANSASYNIGSIVVADAGSYDVIITNSCGSITSNAATLTVNTTPVITSQPGNSTVCAGASASFSVTATGATSYQWRKNTNNISGANSSTYSITTTVTGDAGNYDVVITNGCGSTTSASAVLTVNVAPTITSHPGNITICAGSSATLTVSATGATNYQWRKNTNNISGANSSSYTISSTVTGDAGSYDVVVSNACGSVTSNPATLTVNSTPIISTHPSNLTVCAGASASFSVTASGAISYQWRKNSTNITGFTSSSFTISSTTVSDAGTYDVVITNACGNTTSNPATLTVNAAPTIGTQPSNQTVCVGGAVSFSVTASNVTGYQWRKNTSNISGANSSSYSINPAAATDAGSYDVVLTNACGTTTSNAATLTVNTTAVINSHPSNQTVCVGASATFSVTATGGTNYQWRKNTANISGANTSSYFISSTVAGDAGTYDVVVSNACGTTTSNSATLTINPTPAIQSHPGNQTVCVGATATFSVTATGVTSYQWRKNTSNIGGATSSSYSISSTSLSDAGNYDVVLTNACGTTTSNAATLTVNTTPGINSQPGNQTVCAGSSATFSVSASNAISYQWRKNTNNISGATGTSYTITTTAVSDAGGYDVLITNACGTTTSSSATLTVNTTPTITSHPNNLTVCAGASATFSVSATGATSYQWRKNASNITGFTSSSFTISTTVVGDAGTYDVVITNSCGSTTSNPATLTVNAAPSIINQPSNQSVCVGGSVSFSVTASNVTSYQWRKNTTNITGATSASFSISTAAAGDAGTYDVVLTNACGSTTSNGAILTVNTTAAITSHPSNLTVCAGASATFNVTASGGTIYQWRKNTSNISGANSASYTITSTVVGDAGTYDVVVTNSCGTTTSNPATLTINTTPVISSHPGNQTVCVGVAASFSVTATGVTSYQWRKNTSNITGATSSTFSISSTALADAGSYDVVLTNSCGSTTSNAATLTVNTTPVITSQPSNQTVCAGASATFTVTATGATSYQWRKGTSNIGGATSASYTIPTTVVGDAGNYDVVITNGCGSTTSNTVTLTVNTTPVITSQPSNQTVCAGASASFSVTATGATGYQWRKNTNNISGATSSSFSITSTVVADAGNYDVVITNSCGSTTSNAATLTVNAAPVINTQPSNQSVCIGGSVSFSVSASNVTSYQWRKNTSNITGATSASYSISSAVAGDAGTYDVVLTNSCGSTTSNGATLTVNTTPVITSHPGNITVCAGSSATFNVTATGATSYQWRKGTSNISGATSASFTITTTVVGDAGTYDVVVTNSCGTTTSNPATLTINTTPVISSHPSNQTVCVGAAASFSVTATGVTSYQWRKNTSNITGATSSTYSISSTILTDAGSYDVILTNSCGTTTSNAATLTVNTSPIITSQPSSLTVCSGASATFTVTATGATSYQWRKGTTNIGGATSASYNIPTTVVGDAGNYDVVITNGCGGTTSNTVTLTVNTTPVITSQPSNQTVCAGTSASFSVTATGATSYQWRRNTTNIGGATSSSYSISSTVVTDAGNYDVVITNTCGTTTSNVATLTVNTTPVITSQPSNSVVCEGGSAAFSVVATGAVSYQWRKNTLNIGGATASTFNISTTVVGDAGSYDVVITNTCGSTTSNAATLTVNTVPVITVQPTNQTVCAGVGATFSVTSTGASSYQWRKNSIAIGGATSSSFTITTVSLADSGMYDVELTNSCGTTTSTAAKLTVNTLPVITSQPSGQTLCAGAGATFAVTATGASSYQWRKNAANINGANGATYAIAITQITDAGTYDVVVSNGCGSVNSSTVTLTINTTPTITSQPATQTICSGAGATFSVIATSAVSYQWKKNTVNIGGATSSSFTINPASISDTGSYSVVITNGCGTTISNTVRLNINVSPTINTQPTSTTVCIGSGATFKVSAVGGSLFQWRKNGIDIVGATDSIFTIGATTLTDGGVYTVMVSNICGSVVSNLANLTVQGIPVKPTITQIGTTLQSSSAISYQWFRNNFQIAGATNQTYLPVQSGYYQVRVGSGLCSAISDSLNYIHTGIKNQYNSQAFKIYPNPIIGEENLTLTTESIQPQHLSIYDARGRLLYQTIFTTTLKIENKFLAPGVNLIKVESEEGVWEGKVVKVE